MKLTEHFDLSEFERSETAKRLGIDNRTPQPPKGGDNTIVENLKNLCEKVLEPLREHFKTAIRVTSGYRCPALNKAVGGVKNSQHMTGEAADIQPLSYLPQGETIKLQTGNDVVLSSTNVSNSSPLRGDKRGVLLAWYTWMADNLRFDQLILERKSKDSNNWWIHVSLCRDDSKNRQQCFMAWT